MPGEFSADVNGGVWPPYQSDYRFEMSGAHRKPAYEVGTPSISWHMGFWKPQPIESANRSNLTTGSSESYAGHDRWISHIELLILSIFDKLNEQFVEAERETGEGWSPPVITNLQPVRNSDPTKLRLLRHEFPKLRPPEGRDGKQGRILEPDRGNTRYETVHIDGVWESLPLDIRFEATDEFFTITSTIDFSRMRRKAVGDTSRRKRRSGEFDPESPLYLECRTALYDVITRTNERLDLIRRFPGFSPNKGELTEQLEHSSRFLYYDIWERFRENFLSTSLPAKIVLTALGECFADFRSLCLQASEASPGVSTSCQVVNPWRLSESSGTTPQEPQGTWRTQSLRREVMGHSFKEDDLEFVDAIHPILLSLEADEVNKLAADPVEYTFTKFCNERCIYGSGFGPQTEDKSKRGDPLTYIVLFGFDEHRQMGRLVNRLHTLGTLRLAAIHEFRDIKYSFNHKLDDIENAINETHSLISEVFNETFSPNGYDNWERYEANKQRIGESLTEIHNDLNSLDGTGSEGQRKPSKGHQNPGDEKQKPIGWLPLRAWRSSYYRDRFNTLSKALNSSIIEGYQPYTVFIEHRLSRAHETIRQVSDHYTQLREKERRLRKEWFNLRAEHHQREIVKAQTIAEIFFFLALLPYYAAHVLFELYQGHGAFSTMLDWLAVHDPSRFLHFIAKYEAQKGSFTEPQANVWCFEISCVMLVLFRSRRLIDFLQSFGKALLDSPKSLVTYARFFLDLFLQFFAYLGNFKFKREVSGD